MLDQITNKLAITIIIILAIASIIGTIIEQNQPLDPAAEADVARNAGLEYVHIPVDSKNLSAAQVDAVAQAMAASSGPVLVH